MSVKRLTTSDSMFLFGESREVMMHVASLLIFQAPQRGPGDFLRQLMGELKESHAIYPPWNLKLNTPEFLKNPRASWVEEREVDLEYHVRRSALPAPGDERELGILVSRLHGHPVDFHRPPWELQIIEGLEGGRFALYIKIHHSLMDGFTGARTLARSLSTSAQDKKHPLFFSIPQPASPENQKDSEGSEDGEGHQAAGLSGVLEGIRGQISTMRQVGAELLEIARGRERDVVLPFAAPLSILNGRIGRNRRFATQQYPLSRLKKLAKVSNTTVNDVVMAISAGSLRRFLLELNALPKEPLIAMVPVNVRPKDDPGGGNAVGAILASLATGIADPAERLEAIHASVTHAKEQLRGMSKEAIIQYSTLLLMPMVVQQLTGTAGRVRPAFNVVISNVPGPEKPLYFRGAKLLANYPLSIPYHGQAMNITCNSYAGTMDFGFTGCRDTVPHLQRVAVYTGEALAELSLALGVEEEEG